MNDFVFDAAGLELTEESEGLALQSYRDAGRGVWTVGYGHTGPDVIEGLAFTLAQAKYLLLIDVQTAEDAVNELVTAEINQDEFDALVDFTFNEGIGHFTGSTLLRDLNAGDTTSAAAQFLLWVKAGGKRLPGLVTRREREEQLFSRSL